MMYSRIKNRQGGSSGFTLVELLVYAAGVVLIIGTVVGILFYTYNWYGRINTGTRVDQVGAYLASRLTSDIRGSVGIDAVNSSLGTASSTVTLSYMKSDGSTVSRFYGLSGGRMVYHEGSNANAPISPTDLTISRLTMYKLTSTNSAGIRFSFDIVYSVKNQPATTTYSGFALMRNGY